MRNLLFILTAALIATGTRAESPAIFFVRHAERADAGGPAQADPALSEAGKLRAASLTQVLRDANLAAIYSSEFKRTQQTAAPLAASLGIKVQPVPAKEVAALLARLKNEKGTPLSSVIPIPCRRSSERSGSRRPSPSASRITTIFSWSS